MHHESVRGRLEGGFGMQADTLLGQRYRIEGKLGEGGMAIVYKAHDTLLNRSVAVKSLTPAFFGDEGARRFLREAQSVARLNHPHIVSIFDAVEERGAFAIVMELVEGKTLREILPIPLDRLIDVTAQVLEALEYAHAQGIVHRDIKPENIVITPEGIAKLMDFGLSRSEGRSRLTRTGLIVGTVAYLAPEQALGGQVDGRSDLYSLGAVLYEAVCGRPPFESDDPISVITQHINVPPVAPHWHNPAVPQSFERLILKLLAKDPSRRYQSAREVRAALAAITAREAAATGPDKLVGRELIEQVAHSPLVGRDTELSQLKELIDRAISGQGGVVLIPGPLGVGKTRLVEEAATFARLRGASVISGKAYEGAPPYEPIAKALRDLARGVESDALEARLSQFAPEVLELVPELKTQLPRTGAPQPGSAEDRKHRLLAGVAHFLTATPHPVVLFFDDMHLADAATTELLQHVARRTESSRVLLIAAYRPEDIPSTPAGKKFGQLTHTLSREALCTTIPVRPLTEDQVIDLIKLTANHATRPVRFGQRIFGATEGNPYFIEEVIKGLFEQGTLYIKDGQWSTDFDQVKNYSLLEIPTSAQGAVEVRLRNLDDATRHMLTQAAVVGRQFGFDTLQTLSGSAEGPLLDQIEAAMRAQLIREVRGAGGDMYEFAQPMLRQVLYESIPRRRRRLLHRQAGETLEKLSRANPDLHVEAMAFHFAEAEEMERSLHYSRLAAQKAAAVFAFDEAAAFLQHAIEAAEELDRPHDKLALMETLGDLYFSAGKRDQVIPAFEDAAKYWKNLPGASVDDGARLYRKLGEIGSRWANYNPRTREHIAEGLRLLANMPTHPERVKLIIAKSFDHYWLRTEAESDYATAEASAQEGYRLAEQIGSLQDMSAALDALAGLYQQSADYVKMLAATQQRVPIVDRLDDELERIDLNVMLARSNELLGNYAEALKFAQRALEEVKHHAGHQVIALGDVARLQARMGRIDDVEMWNRRFLEAESRTGVKHPVRRWLLGYRGWAAAIRGDVDLARRNLEELAHDPPPNPALAWITMSSQLLIAAALQDYALAAPLVDEGLRVADTPWAKGTVHTLILDYASQAKDWRHFDTLGGETLERARRSGSKPWVATACLALGVHQREHGDLAGADAFLAEAADLFAAMDARYDHARALREVALLRRAQGRNDEAAMLLQDALTRFKAIHALPDVERTSTLI